jgi:acetyl esterase/lipase
MKLFLPALATGLLACSAAIAQTTTSCATPGNDNTFLNIQTIRLWAGDAPQATGSTSDDIPTLTILAPRTGTANGSAVIVLPGGSYRTLAADLEGREVADWFAARGFRAFVLSYRLSSHGYILPVPLLDARRAVQLVRSRARDYQIDPNRIVMIGFSAGGHLAGLAGTQFVAGKPDADDPTDRVSSRPDYLVLGYAWLGAVSMDTSHLNYCKLYNLMDKCEALTAAYTPQLFVTKDTPPTFMYHTFTDHTVPVEQAIGFYEALVKAGVTSEMHIFANGAHGSGLGKGDQALDQWPGLLENWLRAQGLLTVDKDATAPKP